jgi:antirestriction protein ArdC
VKDETQNFATKQSRVSLLHIIDTSRLIKALNDDKRAIFSAASHAQRAADFLHGLQKATSAQADTAQANAA